MQLTNIIRTISLIGAFVLAATTARAVSPPPDGDYPGLNTAEGGANTLFSLTTGTANTAIGSSALEFDTTGTNNTAVGVNALQNSNGDNNTAVGVDALFNNTSGTENVASGVSALESNTTGNDNTATGFFALKSDTTGFDNTATGANALLSNTTGGDNTATGLDALFSNTIGDDNTATGLEALELNTTGISNTATGNQALQFNSTGNFNTANGDLALTNNTTGSNNIALGSSAGSNLTTGSNNINIGNAGVAGESGIIRIGTKPAQKNAFIAGISGVTVANGVGVIINTQGKLGTVVSSKRFKDTIKPMDKASEAILALKPVTFRYKHELDPEGIPQFGLVAEEVAKVNPDLVARDDKGKPYTVRYEAVNAMLLNEFLKAHRQLEEQAQINQQQQVAIAKQRSEIRLLTSQLQKVSDEVELLKPTPRVVINH